MRTALVLALLAASAPGPVRADVCADTEATLREELAQRFSGPDDPRALERRDRIDTLFAATSGECAKALYERLGESATDDELSQAFHGALATATRARLRARLEQNFAAYDTLVAAIENGVSGAAEREHLVCWVNKLRKGRDVDPRVVLWEDVCPQGEADCPEREHPTDAELAAALASSEDVERASPATLRLFRLLDTTIDYVRIDSTGEAVAQLRDWRRGAANAARRLSAEGLTGPYAALGEWLRGKEQDPHSVLWCPQPEPTPDV